MRWQKDRSPTGIVKKAMPNVAKKLTEIQYEHLVWRSGMSIRPSNSHYRVLDEYAHKANNVYNQALYRVAPGPVPTEDG